MSTLTPREMTADQRLARLARATEHEWQAGKLLEAAKADLADARVEREAAWEAMSGDEMRRANDALSFFYSEIRAKVGRL